MKKYTLYIGSNNVTTELEMEKALQIIEKYFDGYTYSIVFGCWKGKREDTLKVEIVTETEFLIGDVTKELKKELKQDSIMVDTSEVTNLIKFY